MGGAPSAWITRTDTGRLGERTKWKSLLIASASVPARTVPFIPAAAAVTCAKVTEPEALAPIVTGRVSTSRPSISSLTGSAVTGDALRLVSPAVIVTRSSPENETRWSATEVTARSAVPGDATEMGVSVAPSGSRISSWRSQPLF